MFSPSELNVINHAAAIIKSKAKKDPVVFSSADNVKNYLKFSLVTNDREVFKVLLLDTQHRLLKDINLFMGTIDSAAVYPREVLKVALKENAAAIILSHNHPSGIPEPSQADIAITAKIKAALDIIDIRLLDHFVVGTEGTVSLAERGLI
ncbi:RadC family protein [Marinomonas transparens]|nr:DNA repair protein RadC [Marinomonas transparens]